MKCPICKKSMDEGMDSKFIYWNCTNCGWNLKGPSYMAMEYYWKHGQAVGNEISFDKQLFKTLKIINGIWKMIDYETKLWIALISIILFKAIAVTIVLIICLRIAGLI